MKRAAIAILGALGFAAEAHAYDDPPADPPLILFEARDTADFWRNTTGGIRVGDASLNKLQLSAAFDGAAIGQGWLRAYVQALKTNSEAFSGGRTGDIQTLSNIEAPGFTRLFEAWVEASRGPRQQAGLMAIRVGLIDFNRTFDSIAPAGLFLSSSHGIGPDISHSGAAGPSIFPATGPAVQLGWRPTATLFLHAGLFSSPAVSELKRFAAFKAGGEGGGLAVVQGDWLLAKDAQASLGVWRWTGGLPELADPGRRPEPRPGVYAFVEGPAPLPGKPSGWLRVGVADGRAQNVSGYLGSGLVWSVPGRKDDQFGVAVANARVSRPAQRLAGLPRVETSVEATYSYKLSAHLSLQPDVQYIVHPAGRPNLPGALAVGLRIVADVQHQVAGR